MFCLLLTYSVETSCITEALTVSDAIHEVCLKINV